MAITRLWQTGLEHNDASEYISVGGAPSISGLKEKTGSYSLRVAQGAVAYLHSSTSAQASASMYINHMGLALGATYAVIAALYSGATDIVQIRWYADGTLRAYCGSTEVESVAVPELQYQNTWIHIAFDVKIDGIAGWVYVYVDGSEEISFNGDTNDGGASFDRIIIGNSTISGTELWEEWMYMDDIYWNDLTGEVAPALANGYRYYLLPPNGDGNYSQFTNSGGDSINNYLFVDEIPPDDDTTFVSDDTDTNRDSYSMETYVIPVGSTIAAIIPVAKARRESPGSIYGMSLFTRLSAVNDDGSKQTLGTGWSWMFERFTTDPGGGPWIQADVNDMEVGIIVEA